MATHELPVLTAILNLDGRLLVLLDDLERPVLLVPNDFGVIDLTTDETLGVEYGVFGVAVVRIFGGVTDETFLIRETDP